MRPEQALTEEAAWILQSVKASAKPDESGEYQLRANNYRPRIDAIRFGCPRCWVRDAVRVPLRPAAGTEEYDLLRCDRCHADLVVPFD